MKSLDTVCVYIVGGEIMLIRFNWHEPRRGRLRPGNEDTPLFALAYIPHVTIFNFTSAKSTCVHFFSNFLFHFGALRSKRDRSLRRSPAVMRLWFSLEVPWSGRVSSFTHPRNVHEKIIHFWAFGWMLSGTDPPIARSTPLPRYLGAVSVGSAYNDNNGRWRRQ